METMARKIQIQHLLIYALLLVLVPASETIGLEQSNILVSYSFDDDNVATGPDTFMVFERGKGNVSLTDHFRFSGFNSIQIKDVKRDYDFPELQGYFKTIKTGIIYAHFAILVTNPTEELNIALAGPSWFRLKKHGIAFWLLTKKSYLHHVSDSIPKKLFKVEPFVWYVVDITYYVDEGLYDLTIHKENTQNPIVVLEDQENSPNKPKSHIDKFSFIGDRGTDTSNVAYYVDDIVIGTDKEIPKLPHIAPGRKKLFVDQYDEIQYKARQEPGCLPVTQLLDLGITTFDIISLKSDKKYNLLSDLLKDNFSSHKIKADIQKTSGKNKKLLTAVYNWRSGCRDLSAGKANRAYKKFQMSLDEFPKGRIYSLSRILALADLERWEEVDENLGYIYPDWQGDPRYAIAQALIGIKRGDLGRAQDYLKEPAELIPDEFGDELSNSLILRLWDGELDRDVIRALKKYAPNDWYKYLESALIAEQHYYVLLWNGQYDDAMLYAQRIIDRLDLIAAPKTKWLERMGDAAFFNEEYNTALSYYQTSLEKQRHPYHVLLKISDTYFMLRDEKNEREYREKIYGSLTN